MASRRDQRSEQAQAYRHLYGTARWQRTRAAHLAANPLCVMCLPRIVAATVCDHVNDDDKLDPETFFTGEKQSLCATHHDSTKQREEKRRHRIGSDVSGTPLDPGHHWNR
jgi:5-methylcytosine-specific restriction protein A